MVANIGELTGWIIGAGHTTVIGLSPPDGNQSAISALNGSDISIHHSSGATAQQITDARSWLDAQDLSSSVPAQFLPTPVSFHRFISVKNGTQTTTASMVDVAGWDQTAIDDSFTFNSTTGELTINVTSLYQFTVDVQTHDDANGNNRCQLQVECQIDTGSGYSTPSDLRWWNYTIRNNTFDDGGFSCTFIRNMETGDKIKIRVSDVGVPVAINSNDARFQAVRLGA